MSEKPPKDPPKAQRCRRPYNMERRQVASDENRARILAATRELIAGKGAFAGFSIDAVAREAGVARMTVYYQFKSKRGLLDAMFDEIGARGGMHQLGRVFALPDPEQALAEYIRVFCGFWASDRIVMRRLRGYVATDSEFEAVSSERIRWRQHGIDTLLNRLVEHCGVPEARQRNEVACTLLALTGFEFYDALAGETDKPDDIAAIVYRLARTAIGLGPTTGLGPTEGEDLS